MADTHEPHAEMELFLQGEGIPEVVLVKVPSQGTVQDIVNAAAARGLAGSTADVVVLLEDADEPIPLSATLSAAGLQPRARVHVHHCHQVVASVNFNSDTKTKHFPPSATMARVKKWAVSKQGFNLSDIDATEHVLQVCGSSARPDEDAQLGTLTNGATCAVCFDLVPAQRVEG